MTEQNAKSREDMPMGRNWNAETTPVGWRESAQPSPTKKTMQQFAKEMADYDFEPSLDLDKDQIKHKAATQPEAGEPRQKFEDGRDAAESEQNKAGTTSNEGNSNILRSEAVLTSPSLSHEPSSTAPAVEPLTAEQVCTGDGKFVYVLDHGESNGLARYEVRVGKENVYNTASEELAETKATSLRNNIEAYARQVRQEAERQVDHYAKQNLKWANSCDLFKLRWEHSEELRNGLNDIIQNQRADIARLTAERDALKEERDKYFWALKDHLCAEDMADWIACSGGHKEINERYCSACYGERAEAALRELSDLVQRQTNHNHKPESCFSSYCPLCLALKSKAPAEEQKEKQA